MCDGRQTNAFFNLQRNRYYPAPLLSGHRFRRPTFRQFISIDDDNSGEVKEILVCHCIGLALIAW